MAYEKAPTGTAWSGEANQLRVLVGGFTAALLAVQTIELLAELMGLHTALVNRRLLGQLGAEVPPRARA